MSWEGYPFEPEPWAIARDGLGLDRLGVDETLFALGNGDLGVRASYEQGWPHHEPGALLNGFHETWPIVYPEPAYGFATLGQTILYLPDANHLRVHWNGEGLDLGSARVSRRLDFHTGLLTTTAEWPQLTARWERLVSFRHPDVHAIRLTVETAEQGRLGVEAHIVNRVDLERSGQDVQLLEPGEEVDPRQAPDFGRRVLGPREQVVADPSCGLSYHTVSSGLPLSVAARFVCTIGEARWTVSDPDRASSFVEDDVTAGTSVFDLVTSYRRDADARAAVDHVASMRSFETLASEQVEELARLWSTSDVEIEGDLIAQQAVRFAIFHLHQASASVRGRGIAARGVTGRTYEGHYFWDSAAFVVPFLSATNPSAAREVIGWLHSILPKARGRAAMLSLNGALYPWRTITGDEASAFFEAGTAQYHIDADVIHAVRTYLRWTGDETVLWDYGVEMAVETARMWASLGFWDEEGFHIHCVTGPDEYTALVNDNAYTNQMARMNLRFAADSVRRMMSERPDDHAALAGRLELDDDEPLEWERIADHLVVIRDPVSGVTAQDSTFLGLEPWDWSTPREKHPLLLHFHPLVLYRHQLLKQADVVMAHFLLPEDSEREQQMRDFEFYDPLTTRDSSLSPAIQSAVAARLGLREEAWRYFVEAASVDLGNGAGNASGGIHLAGAAGAWLALVHGFAGLAPGGEQLWEPSLPPEWTSMTIKYVVDGEPRVTHVE